MPAPPRNGERRTKKGFNPKARTDRAQQAGQDQDDSDDEVMMAAAQKANFEAAEGKAKAAVHKATGNTFFASSNWAGAVQSFSEAIQCDPTDHVFFSNRSASYLNLGKTNEAVADAKECVKLSPAWAKGYSRLGAALWKEGKLADAKQAYSEGLKLEPTNAVIKQGLREVIEAMVSGGDKSSEPATAAPESKDVVPPSADVETTPAPVEDGPPVLGIDLGTTYSCVAVFMDGEVQVLADDEGRRTVPSYVAFNSGTGERLIGERAKAQASKNIDNTFFDVKRILGQKMSDEAVQKEAKRLPFKIIAGDNGQPLIQAEVNGKPRKLAPEEISAAVLGEMKRIAEARLGRTDLTKAVITVPAYFNDAQRKATQAAGAIAGLEVLRVINEPTAAALAYGLDEKGQAAQKGKGSNILIFDLGGGTFDVTVLRIEEGIFEVKATGGDTRLGGEDFDATVATHIIAELKKVHKLDVSGDAQKKSRVKAAVEKAKRALSSNEVTKVEIALDGEEYAIDLTRAKFEALNAEFFDRTLATVKKVLNDSKLKPTEIDEVVLVGGSTRIPKIQSMLREYMQVETLCKSVNPDEAVAYGAAVQGAILSGCRHPACSALLLVDVTPLSLGIETQGSNMSIIIPRNSQIPCTRSSIFTTTEDYQTGLEVKVFEGERPCTNSNHLLGDFHVSGIERAKREVPQIQVMFALDANGVLNVTASDLTTKVTASCQIGGACKGLSKEEIEKMLSEAAQYAAEDELFRRKLELKNQLEHIAYASSEADRDEILVWLEGRGMADMTVEQLEAKLKVLGYEPRTV
ncbi:unnamed protein product [Polarella glacialis]|uniref:Hsp70-Hsp90 organising protein n=1 Tax=Polarella glacialis TaxID=89957 RepID=A0A813HKW2_POLGL|nr:unnamed protein product [Polarella glacialis]